MGERDGGLDRAQDEVVALEEARPCRLQLQLLLHELPVPVGRELDGLRDAGGIAARIVVRFPDRHEVRQQILRQLRRVDAEERRDVQVVARRDVDVRPGRLVDLHAEPAQILGVGVDRVPASRVQAEVLVVRPQRDPEVAQLLVSTRRDPHRPCLAIFPRGCHEHVQRQLQVGRAARHRPAHGQRPLRQAARGRRDVPAARDEPEAGLVSEDATEMRRDADRARDVAAELQRREPGRDRCGRPARRSARRPRQIPRVARRPVHRVVALVIGRRERHVGLAERDGARRPEQGHRLRVACRDVVGELREAARRRHPRNLPGVLDRDRQPVQRAAAIGRRVIGRPGRLPRALDVHRHDGVDAPVVLVDAGELRIQQLQRSELPVADQGDELGRRQQFGVHVPPRPHRRNSSSTFPVTRATVFS